MKRSDAFGLNIVCPAERSVNFFGRELGSACVTNIWIPDGYKDTPADRKVHRDLLKQSLDVILAEKIDPAYNLDAVEPKLFWDRLRKLCGGFFGVLFELRSEKQDLVNTRFRPFSSY